MFEFRWFLRSIREHRFSPSLHLLMLSQSPESASTPNVMRSHSVKQLFGSLEHTAQAYSPFMKARMPPGRGVWRTQTFLCQSTVRPESSGNSSKVYCCVCWLPSLFSTSLSNNRSLIFFKATTFTS